MKLGLLILIIIAAALWIYDSYQYDKDLAAWAEKDMKKTYAKN